jgi:GYF domain 2/Protein of unknown function (DUF4013)
VSTALNENGAEVSGRAGAGMEIHVSRSGTTYGPYTLEQVNSYLEKGSLQASDWAWFDGEEEWQRLGDVPGVGLPPALPPLPPDPPAGSPPAGSPSSPATGLARLPADPPRSPPEPLLASGAEDHLSIGAAFAFPFRRPDWAGSFWWVALMSYLPVVNLLLLRGWRVDATRRIGMCNPQPFPQAKDLGRFGADGFILWLMSVIFWIPGLFLLVLFGMDSLARFLLLGRWAFEKIIGGALTMTLESILTSIGIAGLLELLIPFFYFMLLYPLYRAGMIRFALTGRASAFFDIPGNLRLAFDHFRDFMLVFFFDWAMVKVGIGLLSLVLSATGIGIGLIPGIVFPAYYWSTAYLYGALADRVRDDVLQGAAAG